MLGVPFLLRKAPRRQTISFTATHYLFPFRLLFQMSNNGWKWSPLINLTDPHTCKLKCLPLKSKAVPPLRSHAIKFGVESRYKSGVISPIMIALWVLPRTFSHRLSISWNYLRGSIACTLSMGRCRCFLPGLSTVGFRVGYTLVRSSRYRYVSPRDPINTWPYQEKHRERWLLNICALALWLPL